MEILFIIGALIVFYCGAKLVRASRRKGLAATNAGIHRKDAMVILSEDGIVTSQRGSSAHFLNNSL